jgi:hypothetical protein
MKRNKNKPKDWDEFILECGLPITKLLTLEIIVECSKLNSTYEGLPRKYSKRIMMDSLNNAIMYVSKFYDGENADKCAEEANNYLKNLGIVKEDYKFKTLFDKET